MAALFTCKRDVVAVLVLLAIMLLAASTQPASATSNQHPKRHPLKATVKNYHKHMTSRMNGVEVTPMCSRTVDVSPDYLEIEVRMVVNGRQVSCYSVPVPLKYLEGQIRFVLELRDCNDCFGCGCRSCGQGCPADALCLKGSIDGKTKFQKCPIIVDLPAPAPAPVVPPVLPPVETPPVGSPPVLPPVALPPVTIPPILDPLAPS